MNEMNESVCDCPSCKIMSNTAKHHFDEFAKQEGLSEDEKKIMRNRIEDLTGFNLS